MRKKEVKTNLIVAAAFVAILLIALYGLINYKYTLVKKAPTNNQAAYHALIGANQLYTNGKYVDAIEQYKKSIEIDPKLYNAYLGLGNSYIELGIYDEAIKTFEKTLNGYFDYRTLYGLGLANYVREDYQQAYFYLMSAYKLNSKNRPVVSYLTNTYNALGLYDEAINLANENLIDNPKNHHLYRKIAVSYLLKGDSNNALENINIALQINDSYHSNHEVLGQIYLYDSNPQLAIKEFKITLGKYKSSWTYEELSVAYYILGDNKSSEENAKLATLYSPHSFSLSSLGFILLKNKKYEKAIEKFEAAINAKPSYYLPYKGLGKVYMELGQKEKAVYYLKKSAELNKLDKEVKKLLDEVNS